MLMHPYDSANPPSDAGWVIQMVCHHYNPYPSRKQMDYKLDSPERIEFGPYQYITERILSKLNDPTLRLFGVHHVALAWMSSDREWTTEKGSSFNNLASNTVPLLDRAGPPEAAAGGATGGLGGEAGARAGMGSMMMGQGMMAGMMKGMNRGAGMGMGERMMANSMMGGVGVATSVEDTKKQLKTLTRTDFLLQFVWQPPKPEDQPKDVEAQVAKLKEIKTKMEEAEKNHPAVAMPKGEEIESDSLKRSQMIDSAISKAMSGSTGGGTAAGAGANPPAPGFGPAPGAAATAPPANKPATGPPPK
jgi:type IV pilus assembly protein PilM